MRGSLLVLGVQVMDEDDDTLTESCCEGAVNFMVIEIDGGSLQELPWNLGEK